MAPFLKETVSLDLPDLNMLTHLLFRSQRRVSSSYSMFWVTDTENVIGDQHDQPCSLAMDIWKEWKEEMESLNDRGWAHQGMSAYAGRNRTSAPNRYWQRHFWENDIWYDMPLYVKVPMAGACTQRFQKQPSHTRWPWWTRLEDGMKKWIGPKFCCLYEDFYQSSM